MPWINYLRVPAALSGMLLLIWFPLIFRLPRRFTVTTTLSLDPFLWHWLAVTGTVLVTLFAAGFTVGEVSELFQHNVGMSAARWDVVLAGAVVGAILGISSAVLGARVLLARRAANRVGRTPTAQVLR